MFAVDDGRYVPKDQKDAFEELTQNDDKSKQNEGIIGTSSRK